MNFWVGNENGERILPNSRQQVIRIINFSNFHAKKSKGKRGKGDRHQTGNNSLIVTFYNNTRVHRLNHRRCSSRKSFEKRARKALFTVKFRV